MAAFTSMALSAAGLGLSLYSSSKQAKAASQYQAAQSQHAAEVEEARRKQMELDATRRQREVIRQAQRARATALTAATTQGAAKGSGLPGGYGQIAGQTGVNLLGISQNLEIGRDIFSANAALTSASAQYASAAGKYGQLAGIGGGLMSLGGVISNNLGTINSLGEFYGAKMYPYGITEGMAMGYDPWSGMRLNNSVGAANTGSYVGGKYFG